MVLLGAAAARAEPHDRAALLKAVEKRESFWNLIADKEPSEKLGARELISYALMLCQSGQHPERLERLFTLATRMQDRDPKSPDCGNLKWSWGDEQVTDHNSVEFCMESAVRIWREHKDDVPESARQVLWELLVNGGEGCLRHHVYPTYTNIAILNSANLILLGEMLPRQELADEGLRRWEAFCQTTRQSGIHEYCSPGYYSVDLNGLQLLHECTQQEQIRRQAAALLELFWTDIALNWFPAGGRLGGAHSRSYDYLCGTGHLGWHLWANGWLPGKIPGATSGIEQAEHWTPPEQLRTLCVEHLPRLVRQRWGSGPGQSHTHMLYPGITLSCSGATYGPQDGQDIPLTVDLAGEQNLPRCYFIADGREDPYGKKKYPTGKARHMKALHLVPYWAGAQRTCDALGLVIYRQKDVAGKWQTNLQSHFVFRRNADAMWLGSQPLTALKGTAEKPARVKIGQGEALVLRYGTAAVGMRIPWSRAQDGGPAEAAVVDDGNPYGVLRLTVEHARDSVQADAGAALWIRVGSDLGDTAALDAWRQRFAQAPATVEATERKVLLEVPGTDGPVGISAEAPFESGAKRGDSFLYADGVRKKGAPSHRKADSSPPGTLKLQPEPTRCVLELDGVEIGRPLLDF